MKKPAREIEDVAWAPKRPVPIELVSLRELHARAPRDLTRPERPAFHVLMHVHSAGRHVIDFTAHALRPGDLVLVRAGQVQQFVPEPFDATMVVFTPDAVRWRPPLSPLPVARLNRTRAETARTLLGALRVELDAPGPSVELAARLVEALGQAFSEGVPAAAASDGGRLLERFRLEVERHFRRTHEVAAYAAILRCTTRTLTRHCVAQTGQAPKVLIDERVALEARRSLAHEETPVAALGDELGFLAPTQFVKFFKRVTGETPGRFRERFVTARAAARGGRAARAAPSPRRLPARRGRRRAP
ncbi:MAG: helix-turn-helix transcriptional regulator [Myxococcaceae bacterium]